MEFEMNISDEKYKEIKRLANQDNLNIDEVINNKINDFLGKLYRGEVDLNEEIDSRLELLEL